MWFYLKEVVEVLAAEEMLGTDLLCDSDQFSVLVCDESRHAYSEIGACFLGCEKLTVVRVHVCHTVVG